MIRGSWSVNLASYKRMICVKLYQMCIFFIKEFLKSTDSLYLEEVFNPVWVITVALSTDSLHFFDLTCFTGSLDVLEVNIRLLAEIHN